MEAPAAPPRRTYRLLRAVRLAPLPKPGSLLSPLDAPWDRPPWVEEAEPPPLSSGPPAGPLVGSPTSWSQKATVCSTHVRMRPATRGPNWLWAIFASMSTKALVASFSHSPRKSGGNRESWDPRSTIHGRNSP